MAFAPPPHPVRAQALSPNADIHDNNYVHDVDDDDGDGDVDVTVIIILSIIVVVAFRYKETYVDIITF